MKFSRIFATLLTTPCLLVFCDESPPLLRTPRIIRGNHATHWQFPHHVSIVVNGTFRCGGSIFSKLYVVTAAHCLYDNKKIEFDAYDLKINIFHISIIGDDPARVVRRVVKVFVPSKFLTVDNWYVDGDIAVLKLNETVNYPLKYNVTLPENRKYTGLAMVTGHGLNWKRMADPEDPDSVPMGYKDGFLRFTGVTIVSNEECSAAWNGKVVPESLICAKTGSYASGSLCDGDSGGPLMYNGKSIIGVLSMGAPKCAIGGTEIFTRVSYYDDFIKKAVGEIEDPSVLAYDTSSGDRPCTNCGCF